MLVKLEKSVIKDKWASSRHYKIKEGQSLLYKHFRLPGHSVADIKVQILETRVTKKWGLTD